MTARQTSAHLNSGAIHLLRALRRIDRDAGISAARLSALSVVVFGGPVTMGELAAAEDVTGPTMTRIVDALQEAGLVRRRIRGGQGRPVEVSATAKGARLMHRAAERRLATVDAALAKLPAADRQRLAAAAPLLDRLAALVRDGQ